MLVSSIIKDSATYKTFHKGELIYSAGAKPMYYYEIKTGKVRMENTNSQVDDFNSNIYSDHYFFGVCSLLCGQPYPVNAFAHTDCELLILPRVYFLILLKNNFDFHLAITKSLSKELLGNAVCNNNIEEDLYGLLKMVYNSKV